MSTAGKRTPPFGRLALFVLSAAMFLAGCASFGTLLRGKTELPTFLHLESFRVVDPYATPGEWYKVQLHVHSESSIDSQWAVKDILKAYLEHDFDFVAITDHDLMTKATAVPEGLIAIPGQESTIPHPFYPVGPHAVFLFINERVTGATIDARTGAVASQNGLVSLAHPSWSGNFSHGRWDLPQVLAVPHVSLMEIFNPYSNTAENEMLWHQVLVHKGYERPVWAVAVDDAHEPSQVNYGWSMVKAERKTLEDVREALQRGSHYPTTGLFPDFWVSDNTIHVSNSKSVQIQFIDGHNEVVKEMHGAKGSYSPEGGEGFVRIALRDHATGRRAWSQPFWLVPD